MLFHHLPSNLTLQELVDWIENLPENDESYRQNTYMFNQAVHGLIAYGSTALEPVIDHLVNTENSWMQWAGIWVLSELGDRRALDAIWNVFHKTKHHMGIQHHALMALSGFKDNRVYEDLIPLLKHQYLKNTAITSLGRLGNPQAVEFLIPMLRVEPLTSQLTKANIDERKLIIAALAEIGSDQTIKDLIAIVNAESIQTTHSSQYDRLRCDAVDAIACIQHPDIIPILQAFLTHPKHGVRKHAREALANLSD